MPLYNDEGEEVVIVTAHARRKPKAKREQHEEERELVIDLDRAMDIWYNGYKD